MTLLDPRHLLNLEERLEREHAQITSIVRGIAASQGLYLEHVVLSLSGKVDVIVGNRGPFYHVLTAEQSEAFARTFRWLCPTRAIEVHPIPEHPWWRL